MRAIFTLSRLEYCAALLALLLSIICASRGLVDDTAVAYALGGALSLMWLSFSSRYRPHPFLTKLVIITILCFGAAMALQLWLIEGIDRSAWMASAGRALFIAVIALTALRIGSSASASRLFFLSLLFFSILLTCHTYLEHKAQLTPQSNYFYAHGFVNPNNAASYFGIMLIISLTQIYRFARRHLRWGGWLRSRRLDDMKFYQLIQLPIMMFGALLFLAGLFLTNSRGGIILALAVCGVLMVILAWKQSVSRHMGWRFLLFLGIGAVATLCVGWMFEKHGAGFAQEMLRQGLDTDHRFSLYQAVWTMIMDKPLLGHGLGGFASSFPAYRTEMMPVEGVYDKAHNSYLELAAEMGLILWCYLFMVMAIIVYRLLRSIVERTQHYGIPVAGFSVVLLMALHSLIDFPLQIPAILALVVAILMIAAVRSDRNFIPHRRGKRSE